jgi:hypothetical protein
MTETVIIVSSVLVGLLSAIIATRLTTRVSRDRLNEVTLSFEGQIRRSRRGAIICDYVDTGTLRSLAEQYAVPQNPEEIEATKAKKRGTTGEFGAQGVKLGGSEESSESQRVVYRPRSDPNVLTEQVITAIDSRDRVRSELVAAPSIGLKEIEALVQANANLPTSADLMDRLVGTAKRAQFKAQSSDDFLLLEASWVVERESSETNLKLAELQDWGQTVSMPSSVALRVRVPIDDPGSEDLITAQGRQRLRNGARVRASVFGRASYFDDETSTLYVAPFAVFSRSGGTASSGWSSSDWDNSGWSSSSDWGSGGMRGDNTDAAAFE